MYYTNGYISWYTKKEDVRRVAKMQNRMLGIVLIGMAIVDFVIEKLVIPKMNELMIAPKSMIWLSIVFFGLGVYFLFREPNYTIVDRIAKKYSKGEMIETKLLMDWRYELSGMVVSLFMISLLIYKVILPIYSLTSSI